MAASPRLSFRQRSSTWSRKHGDVEQVVCSSGELEGSIDLRFAPAMMLRHDHLKVS
jgi:hypothetical protein